MKLVAEKLAKLIDVKSLITLGITTVFCIQVLKGAVSEDYFKTIFSIIIAFYFGTQYEKQNNSLK